MAVRPKSACSSRGSVTSYLHWSYQTRFHPPLSTGANKPRKHLSCKSHCFFSCLLGMFPSCLSASPLLYEVSTRHFLPLHIPCLPAAGQASLQLTKSQNGSSSTTLHIHPCMTHQQTRRTSRMLGWWALLWAPSRALRIWVERGQKSKRCPLKIAKSNHAILELPRWMKHAKCFQAYLKYRGKRHSYLQSLGKKWFENATACCCNAS